MSFQHCLINADRVLLLIIKQKIIVDRKEWSYCVCYWHVWNCMYLSKCKKWKKLTSWLHSKVLASANHFSLLCCLLFGHTHCKSIVSIMFLLHYNIYIGQNLEDIVCICYYFCACSSTEYLSYIKQFWYFVSTIQILTAVLGFLIWFQNCLKC